MKNDEAFYYNDSLAQEAEAQQHEADAFHQQEADEPMLQPLPNESQQQQQEAAQVHDTACEQAMADFKERAYKIIDNSVKPPELTVDDAIFGGIPGLGGDLPNDNLKEDLADWGKAAVAGWAAAKTCGNDEESKDR